MHNQLTLNNDQNFNADNSDNGNNKYEKSNMSVTTTTTQFNLISLDTPPPPPPPPPPLLSSDSPSNIPFGSMIQRSKVMENGSESAGNETSQREHLLHCLANAVEESMEERCVLKYELPDAQGVLVDITCDDDVSAMWEVLDEHISSSENRGLGFKLHLYLQQPVDYGLFSLDFEGPSEDALQLPKTPGSTSRSSDPFSRDAAEMTDLKSNDEYGGFEGREEVETERRRNEEERSGGKKSEEKKE